MYILLYEARPVKNELSRSRMSPSPMDFRTSFYILYLRLRLLFAKKIERRVRPT